MGKLKFIFKIDRRNHCLGGQFEITIIKIRQRVGNSFFFAVIAADATALPETAGGAALLVDPFSVESISNAVALMPYSLIYRLYKLKYLLNL